MRILARSLLPDCGFDLIRRYALFLLSSLGDFLRHGLKAALMLACFEGVEIPAPSVLLASQL
jgi:hypothetical protein